MDKEKFPEIIYKEKIEYIRSDILKTLNGLKLKICVKKE